MDKDYKKELIKLVEKTEINKGYHDYFKNKDLVNNYFEIGDYLWRHKEEKKERSMVMD